MPLYLSVNSIGLIAAVLALYFWPIYGPSLGVYPQDAMNDIVLKSLYVIAWSFGYVIVNQVINYLIWDKIVPRRTGRPVPALLKTISSILLLFVCA